MSEWCMAHPWMTFWIIVITVTSLPSVIVFGRRK